MEHLGLAVDDSATLELLTAAVARITFGQVPDEVLDALRVCEAVALEKGAGEVRPLLVGSTLRRLGLRVLMRVRKEQLCEAAGKHQYGVGRKGGAELLVKCLEAQAQTRPNAVVVKVDLKAAFQTMERAPAFQAMMAAVPELGPVLEAWYTGTAKHLWRDAGGRFEEVPSNRGFD